MFDAPKDQFRDAITSVPSQEADVTVKDSIKAYLMTRDSFSEFEIRMRFKLVAWHDRDFRLLMHEVKDELVRESLRVFAPSPSIPGVFRLANSAQALSRSTRFASAAIRKGYRAIEIAEAARENTADPAIKQRAARQILRLENKQLDLVSSVNVATKPKPQGT